MQTADLPSDPALQMGQAGGVAEEIPDLVRFLPITPGQAKAQCPAHTDVSSWPFHELTGGGVTGKGSHLTSVQVTKGRTPVVVLDNSYVIAMVPQLTALSTSHLQDEGFIFHPSLCSPETYTSTPPYN